MYTQIVFLLVASFTVTEANMRAYMSGECFEVIRCMAPFVRFPNLYVSRAFPGSYMEHYDQLCRAYTAFQTCFSSIERECDDIGIRNMVESRSKFLNYLCLNNTLAGLQKSADSSCLKNITNKYEAHERLKLCNSRFQSEYESIIDLNVAVRSKGYDKGLVEEPCMQIKENLICIESNLNAHCGHDYAVFVSKVYEAHLKQVLEFLDCKARALRLSETVTWKSGIIKDETKELISNEKKLLTLAITSFEI